MCNSSRIIIYATACTIILQLSRIATTVAYSHCCGCHGKFVHAMCQVRRTTLGTQSHIPYGIFILALLLRYLVTRINRHAMQNTSNIPIGANCQAKMPPMGCGSISVPRWRIKHCRSVISTSPVHGPDYCCHYGNRSQAPNLFDEI
jgi:hypothetical protein